MQNTTPAANGRLERFVRSIEARGLSKNTVAAYCKDIQRFEDYLQSSSTDVPDLAERTTRVVRGFIQRLHTEGLSGRSINRMMSSVRAYLRFLHREKILAESVHSRIRGRRSSKRLPRYLNEPDAAALMDKPESQNFQGRRDKAILETLYASGCRLEELAGMQLDDLNLKDGDIRVLGKGRKERRVPVGEYAVQSLEAYLSIRMQLFPGVRSQRLFLNRLGGDLTRRSISRIVKKYSAMLGTTDPISPHVLRHTFATHMLNKGADITSIKDMLGHSSLRSTQLYSHVSLEKLKKMYKLAHPRAEEHDEEKGKK